MSISRIPENSRISLNIKIFWKILFFLLLLFQSAHANPIDDARCEKYLKKHRPSFWRGDMLTPERIRNQLRFEEGLIRKFPTSYIPYQYIGGTYHVMGTKNKKNSALRRFCYKKSVKFYEKAAALCTNRTELRDIKEALDLSKKDAEASDLLVEMEDVAHKLGKEYAFIRYKIFIDIPYTYKEFLKKYLP